MENQKQTLKLQLNDPGLSALHRAGLAGLWMTLDALNDEKKKGTLDWPEWLDPLQMDSHGIEIEWEGTPRILLEWLLPAAFGTDQNQMIDFAGLRPARPNESAQALTHNGVLGTFLQHGKTRGIVKGQYTHPIQLDENDVVLLNYAKVEWYSHREAADSFCDRDDWKESVTLVGWLAPGGMVRHTAFAADTALEESAQRALLLLFAPVGCFYYSLRSTLHSQKARFALVIPEIKDLSAYAQARRVYCRENLLELTACGTADAALRVALLIAKGESQTGLRRLRCDSCQVITLGTVPWSTQQKTRTATLSVDLRKDKTLQLYKAIRSSLENRKSYGKPVKKGEKPPVFVATSVALELFSENLARGRNWYEGFAALMSNSETYNAVKYESEGLNKMIQKMIQTEELDKSREILVMACHEALKNRYGQVKDRANKERADLKTLFQREYDKLRVGLARCKNASTFRQELTDFWSRAGQLKTLQDGWSDVLPMLNEKNWAEARDLALLALASYKRPETPSDNQDTQTSQPSLPTI